MRYQELGVVFPGQGSQSVGMLADIATQFDEVKQTFDEASAALGYDLWHLVFQGPAVELDKTVHTQPALLAASYAVWRIIQKRKALKPALLAGHSLGEYTALVCANALDFTDAIKLVAARGQFMQEAVKAGDGAMAAIIGLEDDAVASLCQQVAAAGEILAPANLNSIGQVVIAGHKAPVERALALAKTQGAKLVMLIPVSVPSHCELMRPAAERLSVMLANTKINLPQIPVINNVNVLPYDNVAAIREGLTKQLYMPVRWVETIRYFISKGVTHIIECGPGKILSGLNKRIDPRLQLMTTAEIITLEVVLQENEGDR